MAARPGPLVKYLCRLVIRRVAFWSINRLMNKHNRGSPISFIKITDKMRQQQLVTCRTSTPQLLKEGNLRKENTDV